MCAQYRSPARARETRGRSPAVVGRVAFLHRDEGAAAGAVTLSWAPVEGDRCDAGDLDSSLQILRFQLRRDAELKRYADGRCWHWIRHADAA